MFRSHLSALPRAATVTVLAAATVAASTVAVATPAPSSGTRTAATSSVVSHASVPSRVSSRVIGSFGKAGTVRGSFVPVRSFVRSGRTVVQGNLTATLRRGNGALVGRTTRHNVTMAIDSPGARQAYSRAAAAPRAVSCHILNLVLGPLNLNLLGLAVHLNRVVLTITALPGAGALLGNLLCAVANLLNGTAPSLTQILQLASLIDRILGLVT